MFLTLVRPHDPRDPSRDFFIGNHDEFLIGMVWVWYRDCLLLKVGKILFYYLNFFFEFYKIHNQLCEKSRKSDSSTT